MPLHIGTTSNNSPVYLPTDCLTSHAAILGITGSGKTACLLKLAEEIARQDIPVILVDLKGDMINIALQKSNLSHNLAVRCITPGSDHGEPVNVFSDLGDSSKVTTVVTSLLRMVGEDSDPLKSKAHSYLSTILQKRHANRSRNQLIDLVHACQEPGFNHLGAMDLDYAFPKKARTALAVKLNNLIVAPSFQPWREGIKLQLDELLYRDDGKTPVLVYSVAHLANSDEQEFALGILLDEVLRWTRTQQGSTKLRAAIMIDECVGLLPPAPANPLTKRPLLLLLKQARAFGVGCVLATQNPVDLDYKAMANCQTWMIGRLSMDKDRARIINGVCASTSVSQSVISQQIAGLQIRQFAVVRPKGTTVIRTADVSCELRGPMVPEEIEQLYLSGHLEARDQESLYRHQLHLAKKQLMLETSNENIKRVADLEQQLDVWGGPHQFTVIQGGA